MGPWPRLACALILIGGLLYLLVPCFTGTFAINHDCALELSCGDQMLDGKLPYRDIVEINPPLIKYLNVLPAAVARLLGVSPIPVFLVLITGLVAWSCWSVSSLLRRAQEAPGELDRFLFVAGWGGVSLLLRPHSFGQREHIFMLLYVPFFVLRWLRWDGGAGVRAAPLFGVLAALGACLKPYFLVIAAAPEIYWVLTRRRWRPLVAPEAFAFVGVGLAYAVHFLFLPASMTDPYFHRWIPLILRGYAAYDAQSWTAVATSAAGFLVLAALCALIAACFRARSPLARLTGPLAAMAVAAYGMAVLQRKGWAYHQIPLIAAAFLLGAVATAGVHAFTVERGVAERSGEAIRHWVLWPIAAAALFVQGHGLLRSSASHRVVEEAFARFFEDSVPPDGKVLVLSTSVYPHYPGLLMASRKPASRYLWSFPLPLLFHATGLGSAERFSYSDSPRTPEEARYLDELGEDIALNRPALVMIHEGSENQGCPPGFDLFEYFERIGFLDRAMHGYKPSGHFRGFALFSPAPAVEASR